MTVLEYQYTIAMHCRLEINILVNDYSNTRIKVCSGFSYNSWLCVSRYHMQATN